MLLRCLVSCTFALALPPALAQSDAGLMPEGSSEMRIGAALGTAPRAPGSTERSAFLVPQFSAQWSNGIFVNGLAVGKQLSSDPTLGYGPVLALNMGVQRADGSRVVRPVLGAFVDYTPMHELKLHAQLVVPALRDAGGHLLHVRASTQFDLASHHWLQFGAGFNLADRRYLQPDFGSAHFQPSGGVKDVFADLEWGWQFSRKFTLWASLRTSRLQGDAAASPRTRQRTGCANALGIAYTF